MKNNIPSVFASSRIRSHPFRLTSFDATVKKVGPYIGNGTGTEELR